MESTYFRRGFGLKAEIEGRLAADYQPEELAGDTDSIAGWIDHICDEHLRDHVGWIRQLTVTR